MEKLRVGLLHFYLKMLGNIFYFILKRTWQFPGYVAAMCYFFYLMWKKEILMVEHKGDDIIIYISSKAGSIRLGRYVFASIKQWRQRLG